MTKETPIKKDVNNSTNQDSQGKSNHALTTQNKKQVRSDDNAKDQSHCMLHGANPIHNTRDCHNLKKHVDKLKKENPCKNNSRKTQEELNMVFKYVNKKMAEDRKHADCKKSACEQELNQFSKMSTKQDAAMDKEEEEF